MTIYSLTRDEMRDRRVLLPDTMLQRMMASVGGHVLNLANIDSPTPIFHKHGTKENCRNHLIFMSSSGFGKSVTFRAMLKPGDGILSGLTLFNTGVRSTFSTEAWLGTVAKDKDGAMQETGGVFHRYKRGIVGADEYQPLKLIFNGEGLGHDEIYLMTALDTDTATKDISYKNIELDNIGLTLWAGMRPTPVKLTSGVARRFTYELFFPSRLTALQYKKNARSPDAGFSSIRPGDMETAITQQHKTIMDLGKVKVDYTEVDMWLDKVDMPHFEENIFRRLALGLSVARGEYPDILWTQELRLLLNSELENRMILRSTPFNHMVKCILRDEPGHEMDMAEMVTFMVKYYQMTNAEVRSILADAKASGIIQFKDVIPKGKIVMLVGG